MNLEDVRAFVAVIDSGSIGHAARRLALTQPAVSRRIQRLEEVLGVTLLDRDSKPAKATRAGEAAYRRCVAVLRAADALARDSRSATAAGPLRVGLTLALSEAVLAPAIEAVRTRCPAVALRLTTECSGALRRQLADGQLDAAVVMAKNDRPLDGPHAKKLGTERVLVVVPKDSPLEDRVGVAALAGQTFVINPDGCGFRAQLDRALAVHGAAVEVMAETWGASLQLALIARGLGIGLIPEGILAASPWRDAVRVVTVEDFSPGLDAWMLTAGPLGPFEAAVEAIAGSARAFLTENLATAEPA
ncbi:Regulatory protein, LysR:LysR, substrate-binding [Rhodovulum sp. PH10]|uniref:LysR family transcriptional regulator n=1 Tax=Rhodovulum sp. PH10 TaxID=1187851 RepID=UPI00027C22EE|nr:LysR family transcriptional regulator [Rhodovulum sp. PH10]EJW13342.1 Regulatory protein, LysR:LysR, substrate-binding [Rhodovulum sp. PH10]